MMRLIRTFPNSARLPLLSMAVLACATATSAHAADWQPTKPVEIVVAAGAGGASDQMARMMQAAIQKNKLMQQPMVVTLKGGASGAEALMYMKSSAGDPNKVLIAYSLIYMLPLSAKIPFNWRELTPVSIIALDQFVLWDNTTLPYKNVKEFVAAAKSANPPFKMGGNGLEARGPRPHRFMEKEDRREVRLPAVQVRRRSGNAARRQSHRRPTSTIRPENLEVGAPARCVRCACSIKSASITDQGDGHPVVERYSDLQGGRPRRPVSDAARDVPAGQGDARGRQRSMSTCFRKVTQTAEYKDYMEKQALKPIFLTGPDMLKFLEEDDALNKWPDDRSGIRRQLIIEGWASAGANPAEVQGVLRKTHGRIQERNCRRRPDRARGGLSRGREHAQCRYRRLRVLLAFAALMAYDNWRTGMGWASEVRRPAISRLSFP
jgi:tripartite-type tricarboxylate transporter receptor subunit TctC